MERWSVAETSIWKRYAFSSGMETLTRFSRCSAGEFSDMAAEFLDVFDVAAIHQPGRKIDAGGQTDRERSAGPFIADATDAVVGDIEAGMRHGQEAGGGKSLKNVEEAFMTTLYYKKPLFRYKSRSSRLPASPS